MHSSANTNQLGFSHKHKKGETHKKGRKKHVTETNEGRAYYLHHTLGKKWSIFLKSFFEEALADLLSLNIPIETTENSIIFTLPEKLRL